ncbi:hypothetical protein LTR66_003953, partial [Elasticomyces elasticus]
MVCPKLTPLQSRFAASLVASIILVIIYFSLSNPRFAYAAELSAPNGGRIRDGEDHNWHRLEGADDVEGYALEEEEDLLLDRIEEERGEEQEVVVRVKRATASAAPIALPGNNAPGNLNIDAGKIDYWVFRNATLWGRKTIMGEGLPSALKDERSVPMLQTHEGLERDVDDGSPELEQLNKRQDSGSRMVYISINTCLQPSYSGTGTQSGAPPQLTLNVSTTPSNKRPGPEANVASIPLEQGFAKFSFRAQSDIYMSVSAPPLPPSFTGGWNYDLAASIDGYYHKHNGASPFLFPVDSDTTSALLVTDNLSQANSSSEEFQKWMTLSSPFMMFAQNAEDKSVDGLQHSFCGLQSSNNIIASGDASTRLAKVQTGMITRGLGNKPKEQFYIQQLNGSSTYYGYLVMDGNSTLKGAGIVGGGGQVWSKMNFTTKKDGNCALLFNLSFCSEVAYAVPSNPNNFPSFESLAATYDSYAAALYQNFSYSLQQIACNTTSTSQYSLAKNCDDCADAYKQWLCAVAIPRCEDYSSNLPWLLPRNLGSNFTGNNTPLPDSILQQPFNPMSGAPTDSN